MRNHICNSAILFSYLEFSQYAPAFSYWNTIRFHFRDQLWPKIHFRFTDMAVFMMCVKWKFCKIIQGVIHTKITLFAYPSLLWLVYPKVYCKNANEIAVAWSEVVASFMAFYSFLHANPLICQNVTFNAIVIKPAPEMAIQILAIHLIFHHLTDSCHQVFH